MFCLSESAENGQSTTHGWRSSRFPPGTVLWTQTRQAMSTYGGEVPRGVLGVDEHQVHSTGRVYRAICPTGAERGLAGPGHVHVAAGRGGMAG